MRIRAVSASAGSDDPTRITTRVLTTGGSTPRRRYSRRMVSKPAERVTRFSGEIRVAGRIVDFVSSGLYESPSACLKELVNNSYDADARRVNVFIKPDADRIIIEDDGEGISRAEFERHFQRLAESHKRDDADDTKSGRPKIGRIGIGMVAANELCDLMEIYSTKKGSADLLHVQIDFKRLRDPDESKRRKKSGDYAKADYHGEVLSAARDEHYTRIFLKGVRERAQEIMAGARTGADTGGRSLYGLTADAVAEELRDLEVDRWEDFDRYSRNLLEVGLNVPVRYHDHWAPPEHMERLTEFTAIPSALNFSVYVDGTELRKPVILRPATKRKRGNLLRVFNLKGEHVSARGYLYATHGVYRPDEMQGVLIRIRNAAVGDYIGDYLGYPHGTATLFQRWVTGELWADDRLEAALNIDRRTLRVVEDSYVELQQLFHKELRSFLQDVRDDLYAAGSEDRRSAAAQKELAAIQNVVREMAPAIGRTVAHEIAASWRSDSRRDVRRLLAKYSVSDVYRIVVEVAREELDTESLTRFIAALNRRLGG